MFNKNINRRRMSSIIAMLLCLAMMLSMTVCFSSCDAEPGPQGEQGIQGVQGEKGEKGDQGEPGAQGAQGEQGLQGEQGPQGEKGDKGDAGATGATGPQGEKGDKGDTGATGPQGEKGDSGVGIVKIEYVDGYLLITYTDGKQDKLGPIVIEGTPGDTELYEIIWMVDGTSYKTYYQAGAMPEFNGQTDKAADEQYTYTFVGWDKEIVPVEAGVTYTAVYEKAVNKYTVTWVVDGNSVEEEYEYGTTPEFKGETGKAADEQYTYVFAGWSEEIVSVTKDVLYIAQYESVPNKYTVKFVNEDGTELQSSEIARGEIPAYTGEIPLKAATALYSYTFKGWDKEITAVTEDTVYTAVYDKEAIVQIPNPEDEGVTTLFNKDFVAGDSYTSEEVKTYDGLTKDDSRFVVENGMLHIPYDETTATHTSAGGWAAWSPNASTNGYDQTVLSMTGSLYAIAGNGAWLSPFVACYVKNQSALPTSAGNGLYMSFNPNTSIITIYNPAENNWPKGWTSVSVEAGLLSGEIKLDIVMSADYSTYVYVTPANGEARLVCTVLFQDGMIRVYNEAETLVAEKACATTNLSGDHIALVTHGGGGFTIKEIGIYGEQENS